MINYAEKYKRQEDTRRIPFLPNIFRCIINGNSGSGKTNLLLNILSVIFDNYKYVILIICSRTIEQFLYQEFIKESEKNYKNLIIYQSKDINIFDEEFFDYLATLQKYKKIIVLDDIIVKNNKDELILNHLFTSTRPREISLFYLSQRFTQLDILCRQQINYLITFKQSRKDLKFIWEEHLSDFCTFEFIFGKLQKKINFIALFCDLEKKIIKNNEEIFTDNLIYLFYSDINDLVEQLKILVGEQNAGNNSIEITNKIKYILKELDKNNIITYSDN